MTPAAGGLALTGHAPVVSVAPFFVQNTGIWDNDTRTWGESSATYSESRPIMLVGNQFFQMDNGVDFGGVPINVTLSRSGLAITGQDRFGQWVVDPGTEKLLNGMWPIFDAPNGTVIELWAGSQEALDDPITWEGPYEFRVGIDTFQDFLASGKYLAVRFTSSGQKPWKLLSYDVNIEAVGEGR